MAVVQGGAKAKRDRVYVQIVGADGAPLFADATAKLGEPMPFRKWVATCAMRVQKDVVAFSWLQPSKVARKKIAESPLEVPHGPLLRLSRQARELVESGKLQPGQVVVEMEGDVFTLDARVDDTRTLSLEMHGRDDVVFELPTRAVRMSLYMVSPTVGRTLAVSFISFPGKPESSDSVVHVASKNLFAICGLPEWRALAGFDSVRVGAAPTSGARRTLKRREVKATIPVTLFQDPPTTPVANSTVTVTVDLETMNHVPGRVLLGFEPAAEIFEAWESYRLSADNAIHTVLIEAVGGAEQMSMLQYDIVLGEVADGQIGSLADGLDSIASLSLTPTQFQLGRKTS